MGIIKNYQTKGSCKVTFSYSIAAASGAKTVQVLGDFNNWDRKSAPKFKKGKDEYSTILELVSGNTYQFRYLLDGINWENDLAADGYAQSPYPGITNSVLILNSESIPAQKHVKTSAPKADKTAKGKKVGKAKNENNNTVKEAKKVIAKTDKVVPSSKEIKTATAKTVKVQLTKLTDVKKVTDDLKKVEGIGPKIAEILVSKGIVTFKDLAKTKVDSLKKILDEAGPKFNIHEPSSWPQQATLAAKGSWAELKVLQGELNAGKAKK